MSARNPLARKQGDRQTVPLARQSLDVVSSERKESNSSMYVSASEVWRAGSWERNIKHRVSV
jgi:hypothetical protein